MTIQLEFNLGELGLAIQLRYMKKQMDDMQESTRKQCKKLFGDLRTLEKRCAKLEAENMLLKQRPDSPEKIEWIFKEDEYLVQVK